MYNYYPQYPNNMQPNAFIPNLRQDNSNMQQTMQNYNQNVNMGQNIMPQSNVNWIRVSDIESAKSQVVQPNSQIWLMNTNEPIFYVKSADNLGVATLKAYKFEEISSDSKENKTEYVTKEEIETIIENKINALAKASLEE